MKEGEQRRQSYSISLLCVTGVLSGMAICVAAGVLIAPYLEQYRFSTTSATNWFTDEFGKDNFKPFRGQQQVEEVTVPEVILNNGVLMPKLAAGTWQLDAKQAEEAIGLALGVSQHLHMHLFHHLDCLLSSS